MKKIKNDVLLVLSNPIHTDVLKKYFSIIRSDKTVISIDQQLDFDKFESEYDLGQCPAIYCLICVEIGWDKDLLHGYGLAMKLMESELANRKVINFHFYSFKTQKQLFQETQFHSRYRSLAKSFPHFQLPFTPDDELKLLEIRIEKWEYLRKFTLSTGGFLASIKHDLEGLRDRNVHDENLYNDIKIRIENNPSIFGAEIINLTKQIPANSSISRVILKIDELSHIIPDEQVNIRKPDADRHSTVKNRMIILEDNDVDRHMLKEIFHHHFDIPSDGLFKCGEKALDYLEKENKFSDVLVCDLELLNADGLDDSVQGIDVIMATKQKYPHIAIRIITNVSRKGINYLVGSKILANEIVFKTTLYDKDYSYLADVIQKLTSEVRSKQKLTYLRGPDNAYWTSGDYRQGNNNKSVPGHLKKYFYHLKFNEPTQFREMYDDVKATLTEILKNKSTITTEFGAITKRKYIAFPPEEDKTDSLEYFKGILLNRLFWINKLYDDPYADISFNPDDFKFKQFFKPEVSLGKNYFHLLGFSCKGFVNRNAGDDVKISFGEFLDDEREWRTNQVKKQHKKGTRQRIAQFDYLNSELKGKTVEILNIINDAGGQYFIKKNYPSDIHAFDKVLNDDPTKYEAIKSVFDQISSENPSSNLRTEGESRTKVKDLINEIVGLLEFSAYSEDLQKSIKNAPKPL